MGILSSHAHAVPAVMHVYGRSSQEFDLSMTRDCAREIMDSCPIQYVRDANLHGSLSEVGGDGGVSCADTQF